jgi:hypothetical protein
MHGGELIEWRRVDRMGGSGQQGGECRVWMRASRRRANKVEESGHDGRLIKGPERAVRIEASRQ